ncbi:MAG: leucine-rich repeat domain-containing protein [Bacteroidales bacterium]|nr:leucine-rich repeat domain-containing protein [Bacteroidales bacterium]
MRKLLLLFALPVCSLGAYSQEVVKVDDVLYTVANGTAQVARQDRGLSGDIVIPKTISYNDGEIAVTSMVAPTATTMWSNNTVTCEGGVFQGCTGITSVTILAEIREIPFGAFYDCTSMEAVTLPESVNNIGAGAFANCQRLAELEIPAGVRTMETYVLGNCQSLTSVELPASLTSIAGGAFKGSGLESLTIPVSVTYIGEQSFETSSFKEIKVGYRNLSDVDCSNIAFENIGECTLLVPAGTLSLYTNTEPWSEFDNYQEYDDGNGEIVETDQEIVLVDGLRYCVYHKTNTAQVWKQKGSIEGDIIIPETVDYNGVSYTVNSITEPTDMTSYSNGSAMAKNGAFQNCNITSIVIPETIEVIPVGAFQGCVNLEHVQLPAGLKTIECAAFADCHALKEIELPAGLTNLGSASFNYGYKSYVFGGCKSLERVNIPEGITVLGEGAFMDSGIKELELPASIEAIEEHALRGTQPDKLVLHKRDVRKLSYTASSFGDVSGCTLMVPMGSKYLYQEFYPWIDFAAIEEFEDGEEAFEADVVVLHLDGVRYFLHEDGHASVERQNIELEGDIVIPSEIEYEDVTYKVTTMVEPTNLTAWSSNFVTTEGGAFQNCAITSISLPSSITVIPAGAFAGCAKLTTVELPEELTQIGAAAFADCSSIIELFIPESVTTLGSGSRYGFVSYVFGNCSSLKKINIPVGIDVIPEACFKNSGLNTLLITENMIRLEEGCFELPEIEFVKIKHSDLTKLTYTESVFPDNISEVTLLVPPGAKDLYSNFYPWKKFKRIEEYDETDDDHDFTSYVFEQENEIVPEEGDENEGEDVGEGEENEEGDAESDTNEDNNSESEGEDSGDESEQGTDATEAHRRSPMKSGKVSYLPSGKSLADLTPMEIEGYEFIGWDCPDSMPCKDVKVKAKYRVLKSSVSMAKPTTSGTVEMIYNIEGVAVGKDVDAIPAGLYIVKYADGKVTKLRK